MRFFEKSQSSDSTQNHGTDNLDCYPGDQGDCGSRDMMCLVYPDGSTTTVDPSDYECDDASCL